MFVCRYAVRVACSLLLMLALITQPARAEATIDLTWIGRSLDELRTQYPDTDWVEGESSFNPNDFREMSASDFYHLDGTPYTASFRQSYGQIAAIWLTHQSATMNAAECQTLGLASVAALEAQFGPFHWDVRTIDGEHLVQTAGGSTVMVSGWRRPGGSSRAVPQSEYAAPTTNGFGLRTRGHFDSAVETDLLVKADLYDTCRLRVEIERRFER